MTTTETIADVVASNLNIVAPVAVFVAAWVLYGVMGKRWLGADDDFWPRIRGYVIPRLDGFVQGTPLWVTAPVSEDSYAGHFKHYKLDQAERWLEDMGYVRNPVASYQTFTAPDGDEWMELGSWARRYGHGRGLGQWLRRWADHVRDRLGGRAPAYVIDVIGRFLTSAGDITARRQVHARTFEADDGTVHVFVHDELNSLNPITALGHYRNVTYSNPKGVRKFRADIEAAGVGNKFWPSDTVSGSSDDA